MKHAILLVDPDETTTERLTNYLEAAGYQVIVVIAGDLALKTALNQPIDAMITELKLPQKNGFELIQSVREMSTIPIIVLSSRQDDVDKLSALHLGANDFILKPCNPSEVIARLEAQLKLKGAPIEERPLIQYGTIQVDRVKRQAFLAGVALDLTNTEFNILEILIKSPGQAFSKEELTHYALSRKFTAYDRSIDVHISNLRNKLCHPDSDEVWIKTVRGFGYMLNG